MAVDKDTVKNLLGQGLPQNVVASAVGCLPQYITELLSDEDFRLEVIALRTLALTANNDRDKKIDALEDDLIDRLKESVNLFYKPNDLLRAFSVVNAAKRRGTPAQEASTANEAVATLQLPQVIVKNFIMIKNAQSEVIQVEGQTLVAMPAHTLLKTLSDKAKEDGSTDRYKNVAKYLPTAIEHGTRDT